MGVLPHAQAQFQPEVGGGSELEILSVAVETADALIVVTDPSGRILRFNPACERLSGWAAEEMIGENAFRLLAPGWRNEVEAQFVGLMRTGGSQRSVGRWVTRSGVERVISFTNTVLLDDLGEPRFLVATGVDITVEREAVAALTASERRHRALVEHSTDVVVVIDADGLVQYVSPSVEMLLGWTAGELEGRPGFDFIVDADLPVVAQSLEETLTEPGPTVPREFRVRDRSGRPVLVEAVANNQLDDPSVNGVILHLRDLSERRTLEATLRTAEERFRLAFAKAPTGIAVMGLDGSFVEVNPALGQILGRLPADLVAHTGQEITHPDDRLADAESTGRLLAGEIDGYRQERRYLRPDGSTVWTRSSVSLLCGPDGEPAHLLAHIEDITDQRSLAQELSHLAHHDGLTGLPNRTAVHRRLDEALGHTHLHGVGVLFIDLDHFKRVNDTYGHELGDRVLRAVSRRLTEVVRPSDFVGRVGGDEFVIVCEPATEAIVARVADRVRERLGEPIRVVGVPDVVVGATVGAVIAESGEDTTTVLRRADAAMYHGKVTSRVGSGASSEQNRA